MTGDTEYSHRDSPTNIKRARNNAPVDDDDGAAHFPEARLDQERSINDADPLAPHPSLDQFPREQPPDGRVHDRVQHFALFFVPKHDPAQLFAVERLVVGLEDLRAKVGDEGREGVRVGFDSDAGEDVEVDDGDAVRLQLLAHRRFACVRAVSGR